MHPPQKQAKTQPTFSTAIIQAKFTSWLIKLNTFMQEIKFASHKQYLTGLLFSIKVKENSYRTKYTLFNFFNLSESKPAHKPSKAATAKKFFSSVYVIDASWFDECFLFYLITGRRYFF